MEIDFHLKGNPCRKDDETKQGKRFQIDAKEFQKALTIMAEKYPRHLSDLLMQNDDATTADVLIQLACFGDIVYG